MEPLREPRAVCAACRRPKTVCYCASVVACTTRTRVVILQHPRERDVPINTARIASLCLPDAALHVGVRFDASRILPSEAPPAALLYPGPGAIDIEREPPRSPITLVVLDGTWWQAKKLLRENPALARLPRYAFRPAAPSEYRIRKEPHEDYLSTIEALAHVLGVLEGDPLRFQALLAPFRAMVEAQLAHEARGESRHVARRREPRPPADPTRRIPALLRERAGDLVCVHAESNAWPYESSERGDNPDELVQWVATRVATGEMFEAIVAPRRPLCPGTPWHIGISQEELLSGMTTDALHEAWSTYLRPSDVICTWGDFSVARFVAAGGSLPSARVDIRQVARFFISGRTGTIDALCTRLGTPPSPPRAAGRAGLRLASLAAVTSFFADL